MNARTVVVLTNTTTETPTPALLPKAAAPAMSSTLSVVSLAEIVMSPPARTVEAVPAPAALSM